RKVVAYDVVLPGVSVVEETPIRTSQYYIACVNDSLSKTSAATAIRVLAMLIERHPDLRLMIVGEGPYEDDLRMQAAALRVLNLVSFVGDRDDEIEVMRNARFGWVVAQGDTGAFAAL